jgi:hypothetical protein
MALRLLTAPNSPTINQHCDYCGSITQVHIAVPLFQNRKGAWEKARDQHGDPLTKFACQDCIDKREAWAAE